MKLLLSFFLVVSTALGSAQHKCRETTNGEGKTVDCHFSSGELSTRVFTDVQERMGKSAAYNKKGEVIFERHTRKFGGHASVHFSYHANGGISKAELSDAPDGGIQWYESVTTFDEEGNQTGFSEQGHDDLKTIPHVVVEPPLVRPDSTKVPVPAACQEMYVNTVYLVNATSLGMRATVNPKNPSPALMQNTYALLPGDTTLVGSYSIGQSFDMPDNHLSVDMQCVELRKRRKPRKPVLEMHIVESLDGKQREYFVAVVKWRK